MEEKSPGTGRLRIWFFGILLPVVAVLADPAVFRGNGFLSECAAAGYTLILIGVVSTCYWLLSKTAGPVLAGTLAICSFGALVIGVVLLPLSVIGALVFGIGLLGLIPFGTAYVLCRCSMGAWAQSAVEKYRLLKFGLAVTAVPIAMMVSQLGAARLVSEAERAFGNPEVRSSVSSRFLIYVAEPFGLRKQLIVSWSQQKNPAKKQDIASAYEATFGTSIQIDETVFFD
jgi:hypothetical protein